MNLLNEGILPPNEPDDRDERREERKIAQKRETVADIVAEMNRTKYGDDDCSVKWCLQEWADRIEAAWKREREALEAHVRSLQSQLKVAYSCGEQPQGNAAAMREALMIYEKQEGAGK